jgi:hypothetical protein
MSKALGLALLVVSILPAGAPGASADPTPSPADSLAWMAGCWSGARGASLIEECWLVPRGGLLLGVNRTTGPGGRTAFEFLRIEAGPHGLVYRSQPSGKPATAFPAVDVGARRVVFENPAHDFPQRVLYWLDEAGALHARIEGTTQGKASGTEWTWTRCEDCVPGARERTEPGPSRGP